MTKMQFFEAACDVFGLLLLIRAGIKIQRCIQCEPKQETSLQDQRDEATSAVAVAVMVLIFPFLLSMVEMEPASPRGVGMGLDNWVDQYRERSSKTLVKSSATEQVEVKPEESR